MQQYNCQNGQSWYDVCLNTYGSLDYLGKLVSDNSGELNIQPTTNTVIYWDQSLVKDSSLLSLIKNNGYVYNTGVQIPLPYIQAYTSGISQIDFTNNGGDDWDIGFKIAPTSKQPSGLVIDSYDFNVFFWSAGTDTEIEVDTKNTDYDLNTSGNGAGVYQIDQNYLDSNGDVLFTVLRFIKVDGSGNILADYEYLGSVGSSVSGLSMTVTAEVNEVNCTNIIEYYAFDEETPTQTLLLGSGISDSLTLPIWAKFVVSVITLDSVFTSDYIQIPKASISITIN